MDDSLLIINYYHRRKKVERRSPKEIQNKKKNSGEVFLNHNKGKILFFKEIIELVFHISAIIALIIGGIWTYYLVVKQRNFYPIVNIEEKISHVDLPKKGRLVRIEIELNNLGKSKIVSKKALVRLQQILPILNCKGAKPCWENQIDQALNEVIRKNDRFTWPLLAERQIEFDFPFEIEPGEKELIDFEFVIPLTVEVTRIYCYFRNEEKTRNGYEVGWSASSIYDMRGQSI